MKIGFDHCYMTDQEHSLHSRLKEKIFANSGREVEHPGTQFCRFFMTSNSAAISASKLQYLELIDIRDWQAFLKVKGHEQYTDGRWPGLSFTVDCGLEDFYNAQKDNLEEFGPTFYHKNFAWKKDSVNRLPGWNFLTFDKDPIEHLYIWFTEYETDPSKQDHITELNNNCIHPSSIASVREFVFDLNQEQKKCLEKILARPCENGTFLLDDGIKINCIESSDYNDLPFLRDKVSPYKMVSTRVIYLCTKKWNPCSFCTNFRA